jgi:hypothetical protein
MRQITNGKIYNTATMTVLATRSCYNNGNYCGSDKLCRTRTGLLAMVRTSNGQDLYRHNGIEAIAAEQLGAVLDGWELDDEEQCNLSGYLDEV